MRINYDSFSCIFRYFPQDDLLDKVPPSFLIFGATYAVMQLVGVVLLSEPTKKSHSELIQVDLYKFRWISYGKSVLKIMCTYGSQ